MPNLFELKLTDSPIPQAMEVYYEAVEALVKSGPKQKIALANNIVDFPIRLKTRLFNNYVARSFADRSISRGSPIETGDKFLGPANINDRFSYQYEVLINRAIAGIELSLDQESQNKLEESKRLVEKYEESLNDLIDKVLTDWEDYKSKNLQGLTPAEIEMRQVAWLDIHRLRRRMEAEIAKIDRELSKQEQIVETVGTPEDTQIYRTYNALRNSRVAYPKGPQLEIEKQLDEIKMGNPLIVGTNPNWADIGADVDAVADWENFLQNDGERGFGIFRDSKTDLTHEKQWSASATYSYDFFFSASINAAEHTRTAQAVGDTLNIKFKFKRISEVWIRRGNWYDSSIFNLPKIKKILNKDKKLAANLRYSVASLLVGRGFTMKLEFVHTEHYEYFRNQQMSGSAKLLNIFPVGLGSVNETDTELKDDAAGKSVTFADGVDVVRMIGFKVDEMHSYSTDKDSLNAASIFPSPAALSEYLSAQFKLPGDYFTPKDPEAKKDGADRRSRTSLKARGGK